MSNGNNLKEPWWQDGSQVSSILTQIFGFLVTIVTVIWAHNNTAEKVEKVQQRQVQNTKTIDNIHKQVNDHSVIMGMKPPPIEQ